MTSGGTQRRRNGSLNQSDTPPLFARKHPSGLDVLGHRRRERMGEEHRQNGSDNDPNNIDQSEVLPPVVDDEDAHHGDRGVDNPIYENRFIQSVHPSARIGQSAQIGSTSLGRQDLSKNEANGL